MKTNAFSLEIVARKLGRSIDPGQQPTSATTPRCTGTGTLRRMGMPIGWMDGMMGSSVPVKKGVMSSGWECIMVQCAR